jgi:adenylylsulfate kinase
MAGEEAFAVWLTGLPASGKSTLAGALAGALASRRLRVQVLDSDELRAVLTPQPSYSREERRWFYRVMVYVGRLLVQNGVNVIFAATANRRAYRQRAQETIERFTQVYVHCSLETCIARDTKGIYAKALAGEAQNVPGLQVAYDRPDPPALTVDTEACTPAEGVRKIVTRLEALGYVYARNDGLDN